MVRVMLAVLFSLLVTACSLTSVVEDVFNGDPVAKKEPVTYTCIGATEYFVSFKPNIEQLQIWPFNVTVVMKVGPGQRLTRTVSLSPRSFITVTLGGW